MKQFLAFVEKEFYHIFRDRKTMLILLVMPVVQILLFGFAITTEVRDSRVVIFDPSKDNITEVIKEKFAASPYFTVYKEVGSYNEIEDLFKQGKLDMAILFSESFANNMGESGDAAVQLIVDGTDPNYASILNDYANAILLSYQQELMEQQMVPFQVVPDVKMLYNPQLKSAYNFVPGVMGMILILICSMMTSVAIVREKEMGTMEVLLSSPLKPIYIILSKMVPYLLLSIVNLITILLLSVFVLGVPVAGSLFWLIVISLLFIFTGLALGLFISTVVDTQMAAMLVSGMGLMAPVVLLSGMIFPVESMPKLIQWISAAVPARWYIDAMRKLLIQGVSVRFVLKESLIIGAMTVSFVALALKQFKVRLS